jgi:hypothetical protein
MLNLKSPISNLKSAWRGSEISNLKSQMARAPRCLPPSAHRLLLAAFCFLVFLPPALAQNKTVIMGVLYNADGSQANGTLFIQPTNAFVSADGYPVQPGPVIKVSIVSGSFSPSLALIPNAGSSTASCTSTAPAACSYYTATFALSSLQGNYQYTQTWLVPATGPVAFQTIVQTSTPSPNLTFPFQQLSPPGGSTTCLGQGGVPQWTLSGWICNQGGGSSVSVNESTVSSPDFTSSLVTPDTNNTRFTFKVVGSNIIAEGIVPFTLAGVSHQFVTAYSALNGGFTLARPACADLSDSVSTCNTLPTPTSIGLGNVTNAPQTLASVMPNTPPSAGQLPIGNAGGTSYVPTSITGDCSVTSAGVFTCTKSGGVAFGTGAFAPAFPYPAAGIPNSTGSGWATSFGPTNPIPLADLPTVLPTQSGLGGGIVNTVGLDGIANVLNFGAVPVLWTVDAAMSTTRATFLATGSSTSPATPAGTTTFANEVLIPVYAFYSTLTAPSGPTAGPYVAGVNANHDGIWAGYQTQATAGAYGAITATQANNGWTAFVLPLIPTSGNTITPGNYNTNYGNGNVSSLTITKPAGVVSGHTLLACLSSYGGWPLLHGGWTAVGLYGSSATLSCFLRVATSGEPASYAFTTNGTGNISGFVWDIGPNVAAVDNALTSALAGFSSGDVGKTACVWNADISLGANLGMPVCGPIGIVLNSTTIYPLFANTTTAALSAELFAKGAYSGSAFKNAASGLPNGGQIYAPTGGYIVNAGDISIPYNRAISIGGAGATLPVYSAVGGSGWYTPIIPQGSALIVLSDLAGDAGITYQPSPVANQYALGISYVHDLTIMGTGGAGDGIDFFATHSVIERNAIHGFMGSGILVSSSDSLGGTGYSGNVDIRNNYLNMNGGSGLDLESAGDVLAQIRVSNNEMDKDGCGITIGTGGIANAVFDTNVYQWGGVFCIKGSTAATTIIGGWHETNAIVDSAPAGSQAPTFIGNYFNNSITSTNGACGWNFQGNWFGGLNLIGTFCRPTADSTNFGSTSANGPFNGKQSGTAGTATYLYSVAGGNVTVNVYLNGYQETGSAQTWAFPFPFATTPVVGGASCGTYPVTASTTTLTLPANASMTAETCQVIIQGQTN